jgi:hypothetical protein
VWDPFGGCAGIGFLQHLVDLLEGETLSLGNQKVHEGKGDTAESTPKEENLGAHISITGIGSDKVWGDDSDDLLLFISTISFGNRSACISRVTYAVPEPIGSSGEADTARADGKGEYLANNNPCSRTLGGSEEKMLTQMNATMAEIAALLFNDLST